MKKNLILRNELKELLPDTYHLLNTSDMTVHEKVTDIVLHGSRGLAGGARPDSDIDLTLITDTRDASETELEELLEKVTLTTLDSWQGDVELDLAVVFDSRNCGLKCFYTGVIDETLCPEVGTDCFGLYKIQKGFTGLVHGIGVDIQKMFPCTVIWSRV